MISPLAGATDQAGLGDVPAARLRAEVVDEAGRVPAGRYLTLTSPWPGVFRGIWGDPERSGSVLEPVPGPLFRRRRRQARRRRYFWLLGRVDDVMNVSGHRISTTEVESALVSHPAVAEAAVVGCHRRHHRPGDRRLRDVCAAAPRSPGRATRPCRHGDRGDRQAQDDLFHPRSAEDPQRQDHAPLLRDVAEGRNLGDTTTLADATSCRGDPAPAPPRSRRRTDPPAPPTDGRKQDRTVLFPPTLCGSAENGS